MFNSSIEKILECNQSIWLDICEYSYSWSLADFFLSKQDQQNHQEVKYEKRLLCDGNQHLIGSLREKCCRIKVSVLLLKLQMNICTLPEV